MGIMVHVESIIPISSTEQPYMDWAYRIEMGHAYLKVICANFGWEKVPWQEPSKVRGTTETSANYTKYELFQNVARGYYGLLEKVRPEDGWGEFPHLLKHDGYVSYYLA